MSDPADREVAVFAAARRLPAGERAAYLDEACAGNAPLRQRVEELLLASEEAGGFLQDAAPGAQRPADALASPKTLQIAAAPWEKPGDRIGRYKLLQQIGEGGCGVVYMAEQEEPVRRRVALKVIKLGMDTKQVVARFEAERQALALMDHPNIAKVLEAGATDTGRPYFVMELVRGIKITQYCDENNLSTRERLDLFIKVAQAVQHAHQKGIIHRDLKPSNILVADHDGVPVPKIIDFGIAKATTDQRLTDKTLFTAFEQFIGTPAYMSPEQARMSGLDIDTRTDIYSLGVLLYELLTGKTPFDADELLAAGLDEMRRTISEQEPARPSTRLSTMLEGELTNTAKHRHTDAPKLVHLIRGDLDWIVMKALEKDRARRYETANGLAMDIQRHLDCEPVVARPPSRLYEFQKTVRRHKFGFAAGAAIIMVLAVGVMVSTWQAIRATRAEREQSHLREAAQDAAATEAKLRQQAQGNEKKAEAAAAKSQQVTYFLKQMLVSAGPEVALGRDTTLLREILDKTANAVNNLTNQPEVQAELLNVSGWVFESIGERERAETSFRQALAIQRKLPGQNDPALAVTLAGLAQVLDGAKKPEESESCYRESLEIRRKFYGNENWMVAGCLNNLTGPLVAQGKLAEAETFSREALAMKRKLLSNEWAAVSTSTNADQALAVKRRILANCEPEVAVSLRDLGLVLRAAGKLAEAEGLLREGLATFRRTLGDEHPDVAFTLNGLAYVLSDEGKLPEAEAADREALVIQGKLYDAKSFHLANTRYALQDILKKAGRLAEAETLSSEVRTTRLADVYGRQGRWKEALADYTKLVEVESGEHTHYHKRAPLQLQLGDLEGYRQGCAQELARFAGTSDPLIAERMAKDCLLLPDSGVDLSAVGAWADTAVTAGKDSGDLPWFQLCKGLAEYRQDHFAAAVDWMQKVLAHAGGSLERDAQAYLVLAMAQHHSKQPGEASVALAKGVEIVERKLPKLESGDLGDGWVDWIIAHALMREAKALIQGSPATRKE